MRAGVPKKAWLKFPLRLYGWASSKHADAHRFAIVHRPSLLIPGTFVRRGLERRNYINTAPAAQCVECIAQEFIANAEASMKPDLGYRHLYRAFLFLSWSAQYCLRPVGSAHS